jgi:hypothetical protein
MHHDWMSARHTPTVLLRLAALTAVAFALVAAGVSAIPSASASATSAAPQATASASCVAQIKKGSKFVPVYEVYYKYAFKKVKGSKRYKRVVVKARRKLKVSCARQCVRTKLVKKKRVPVYKVVTRRVKVKVGHRLVSRRKKVRVYTFQKCPRTFGQSVGNSVDVTILDGSHANLDFGAFQREAPITGTLRGLIPGGYKLSQDNQINLTKGDMAIEPTPVFIDDLCNGKPSAAIRTGDPSPVSLDPTKNSISTLTAAGGVTATAYTVIRLSLALRNDDDGCDRPYESTGYTEFQHTFFLKGKIGGGSSLARLHLTSAAEPLDVQACLARGASTSPCNNDIFIIPLPIIVSLDLTVKVDIKVA